METSIKKISKSYGQMTQKEKEYVVQVYYEYKNLPKRELMKLLDVSHRAMLSVMKEFNINSKRKNRYTLNEQYFDIIDTEAKAYCLGFLYADGFVGDERTNNIVFSSKDKDILEKIAKEIEFTSEIRKAKKGGFENSKESYSLNFSSNHMAESLRKLGLFPNKSLSIDKIPNIEKSLLRHFLRGYFDGDGSVSITTSSSINKGKKYSYQRLIVSIIATSSMIKDIVSTFEIKKYSVKDSKTKGMQYLYVKATKEIEMLYDLLYKDATIYLNRKYEVWINYWGLLHGNMQLITGKTAGTIR